jgi:hypothetical protein
MQVALAAGAALTTAPLSGTAGVSAVRSDEQSGDAPWPEVKTARDLCAERILPVSEDYIRALAKKYGIGKKLGRTYVFTADDVAALIRSLPRPGE